jgi:hypothetical protein
VTAVITGERGDQGFTRYGLEEYVADCGILLDHRIQDQVSTRRLRVVKYRGSGHGTNEYPFLIGAKGLSVLPITSLGLHHPAQRGRLSTGIPGLDAMLGGSGVYRGSSVLVSGSPGTKSSIGASPSTPRADAVRTRCSLPMRNLARRSCATCDPLISTSSRGWKRDCFRFTRLAPRYTGWSSIL